MLDVYHDGALTAAGQMAGVLELDEICLFDTCFIPGLVFTRTCYPMDIAGKSAAT
jgi:hypothetical protein